MKPEFFISELEFEILAIQRTGKDADLVPGLERAIEILKYYEKGKRSD